MKHAPVVFGAYKQTRAAPISRDCTDGGAQALYVCSLPPYAHITCLLSPSPHSRHSLHAANAPICSPSHCRSLSDFAHLDAEQAPANAKLYSTSCRRVQRQAALSLVRFELRFSNCLVIATLPGTNSLHIWGTEQSCGSPGDNLP